MAMDSLKTLLVRFQDATNRYLDTSDRHANTSFAFNMLTRDISLKGTDEAITHLRTLAEEALAFLPATYLKDEGLLDPKYNDTELWCLGVIAVDWRLGRGTTVRPAALVESVHLSDGTTTSYIQAGFRLRSPFAYEEDIEKKIREQNATKGSSVTSITCVNHVDVLESSCNAVSLLLYRAELASGVDHLVPSYENAVRLTWDIEDLIAVAEQLGKSSVLVDTHNDPRVTFGLWGSGITVRLGIHRSGCKLPEFVPEVREWGIRAQQSLRSIPKLMLEYYDAVGLDYTNLIAKIQFRYSDYPPVPDVLLDAFRSIVKVLNNELIGLVEGKAISPRIEISVRDVLQGLDSHRKHPISTTILADVKSIEFDVFLAHNSEDKATAKLLSRQLVAEGLNPWLDVSHLIPGRRWLAAIADAIPRCKAAAILIGEHGLGPIQDFELDECIKQCTKNDMPVIPVLLPGAGKNPSLPRFLDQFTWVDLRPGLEEKGIRRLICGIRGQLPGLD